MLSRRNFLKQYLWATGATVTAWVVGIKPVLAESEEAGKAMMDDIADGLLPPNGMRDPPSGFYGGHFSPSHGAVIMEEIDERAVTMKREPRDGHYYDEFGHIYYYHIHCGKRD